MILPSSTTRQPLRELLASAEHGSNALVGYFHTVLEPCLYECLDLSRPVRRRSGYPTVAAVGQGLKRLEAANNAAEVWSEQLLRQLEELLARARRECVKRSKGW